MKIYEDKKLWKKTVIDNLNAINNKRPEKDRMTEKQIEEIAEARVNDKERLNRYLELVKDKEDRENRAKLEDKYVKEYVEIYGKPYNAHGFGQISKFYLDMSGTKEADEKNRKFIFDMADPIKARKAVTDVFKNLLKLNKRQWYMSTVDEKIDYYNKNRTEIWSAFVIGRMLTTATDQVLNPEFRKLFEENKTLLEKGGEIAMAVTTFMNPNYLTIPDMDPNELLNDFEVLRNAQGSNLAGVDGFRVNQYNYEESSLAYISTLVNQNALIKTEEPVKEIFKKGYVPPTIGYDYKIVENNETINTITGIEKCIKNEKVEILKRSKEELLEVDRLIDHAFFDSKLVTNEAEFTVGTFKNVYNALKKADHWYNKKNSPEYTQLLSGLEEVINNQNNELDPYALVTNDAPRIKELADAYIAAKANQTKNTNRQKRFDLCKILSDYCSGDFINMEKACPSVTADANRLEQEEALREELQDLNIENDLNKNIEPIPGALDNSKDMSNIIKE